MASGIKPLVKEIAFPVSKVVDALGTEVQITPEMLAQALDGTRKLQEMGFVVRGYSSHFTDDSRDIMGEWPLLFIDEEDSLQGVFVAMNDDDRDRAKRLDTSMIVEEAIEFNGITIPLAVTRVDVVGQGALIGTEKFQELFSAHRSKASLSHSSRRCFVFCFSNRKVAPMSLAQKLSEELGLQDGATDDEIAEAVMARLQKSEESPEAALMDEPVEDPEEDDEEDVEINLMDEEPAEKEKKVEMSVSLSRAQKTISSQESRIQKLERRELDQAVRNKIASLSSPIPKASISKLSKQYDALRKRGVDHDFAMDLCNDLLDGLGTEGLNLSGAKPVARKKKIKASGADEKTVDIAKNYFSKKYGAPAAAQKGGE